MAQKNNSPALALRSSTGVEIWKATGSKSYISDPSFVHDESKNCRAVVFSPDGRYLAWANGTIVQISTTDTWKVIATLPRPKAFYLKFSPNGTYLMSWEIFTTSTSNPNGSPNLYLYKIDSGEEAFSTIQKRQIDWEPHWSTDESIIAMMIGGEVLFYELNGPNGLSKPAKRLGGGRNGGVSLSPGNGPPHIGFYVPGVKGQPSMCKLYKYPNVDALQPIASKSFFQADKVDMIWNSKGNGMLLMTSTDVDSTGVSYYGKQALHFINIKGDSFSVQLNAEGPIHSVEWSPKSTEFCVVYGYMPAKAVLFNTKCDPIYDFGTGSRNAIYYNTFGNILLLGGFGNLRGQIEVWDLDKKKQIATTQAPDTTQLAWNPAGDVYVTATCAPRLRIGNGFKVWHYSGALLHETLWPEKQELWEVAWQVIPSDNFLEPIISEEKIEGIQSSQPQVSTQKYVPPCIRDNLTSIDEKYIPGLPPGYQAKKANQRRATLAGPFLEVPGQGGQRRNSYQQRRGSRQNEKPETARRPSTASGEKPSQKTNGTRRNSKRPSTAATIDEIPSSLAINNTSGSSNKAEKDPRISKIHKKLREIRILKEKQEKGDKLDGNQMQKLQSEQELVTELSALKLADKTEKQLNASQPDQSQ